MKPDKVPPFFQVLNLLLCAALVAVPTHPVAAPPPTRAALENCPTTCGSVPLPYPFGFGRGCYRQGFQVECNSSSAVPMILLRGTDSAQNKIVSVTNISEVVTVQLGVVTYCGPGMNPTAQSNGSIAVTGNVADVGYMVTELGGSPYTLSDTRNKLVVLGCYSFGQVMIGVQPAVICVPTCTDQSSMVEGSCSVLSGCCQSIIPSSIKDFVLLLMTMNIETMNETYKKVSRCSYSFIMETEQYPFRPMDLTDYFSSRGSWSVPVALDWAIEDYNCSVALTSPDYACGANASCVDSTNGPGYRCSCNSGFAGNPYVADGCQDINECQDRILNTCSHICTNMVGNFTCSCPTGTYGDGHTNGTKCIRNSKRVPLLEIILSSGFGFLLLLLISFSLYGFIKKRNLIRLREKFFEQNGGRIMRNIILSHNNTTQIAKIFTEEDLMKATNNYSKRRIIGKGGFGTVYKGKLPDKTLVAIKKSKIEEEGQVEQFINEIVILSQIKHRNVVTILGCCLDSQVPLLVYEYIPNGTLFYHLHNLERASSLSWQARLRISVEIADAINYLHSFALQPIVHRDIKSSNILLDEDYNVKVSDFGISKIVPFGEFEETTILQGTWGYIDPESFETGQLTSKSDVYSFGVILAELLTGKLPMFTRNDETINLASHFIASMEDRFFEVLEPRVKNEGEPVQLRVIGNLTSQCLRAKGVERPCMREISAELNKLRSTQKSMYESAEEAYIAGNQISSSMPYSSSSPLLRNVS